MSDPGSTPTRFAQVLQEYMWGQRPPLNGHKLARQLGIGTTTVYGWLNGVKPDMALLPVVSQGTGIAMNTLLEAAGYPLLKSDEEVDAVFDFIERQINASSDFSDEQARREIRQLNERWRAAYKAVLKRSLTASDPDQSSSGSEPQMRAIV